MKEVIVSLQKHTSKQSTSSQSESLVVLEIKLKRNNPLILDIIAVDSRRLTLSLTDTMVALLPYKYTRKTIWKVSLYT